MQSCDCSHASCVRQIDPRYKEESARVATITADIEAKEARLNAIYDKQGRKTTFRSRAERDKYLQGWFAAPCCVKEGIRFF